MVIHEEDYLAHYGVLGMKWGRRRYQNKDGSLTEKGKKRVSAAYKKESEKVMNDLSKNYNKMYMDSYNRAADKMNNGGIDKFNKRQEKKYGKKYADRKGYEDDYFGEFEKVLNKELNKSLNDFYASNESFKKSQALVKEFGMTKWDDLAKNNAKAIEELKKAIK